jgi:hypothetical protein
LLVVDLVTVRIDEESVPIGEGDRELDRAHPILSGVFKVGNGPDHVDPAANRLFHQRLAIRKRFDSLLGEGHELDVNNVANSISELDERVERNE